jgi:hypothetical protein
MNDTVLQETDFFFDDSNITIEEDVQHGERTYFYKGNFGRSNFKNKNGRVYPTEIMSEAYNAVKESMKAGNSFLGECEHPQNPELAKRITFENVCVKFEELNFNESTGFLTGIAKPTSFGKGDIAKGLIRDKIRVGFSTRAAGAVKPGKFLGEDCLMVQPGLKLISCDLVSQPSAGTYPTSIMEGTQENFKKYYRGVDIIQNLF